MHTSDERPLKPQFNGQFAYIKQLRADEETGQQTHIRQILGWQPAPHHGKLLLNSTYCCKARGSATSCVEREKRCTVRGTGESGGCGDGQRWLWDTQLVLWKRDTALPSKGTTAESVQLATEIILTPCCGTVVRTPFWSLLPEPLVEIKRSNATSSQSAPGLTAIEESCTVFLTFIF